MQELKMDICNIYPQITTLDKKKLHNIKWK